MRETVQCGVHPRVWHTACVNRCHVVTINTNPALIPPIFTLPLAHFITLDIVYIDINLVQQLNGECN